MSKNYTVLDKTSAFDADVLFLLKKLDKQYFPTPWDYESWDHLFLEGADRFILIDKDNDEVLGFILFELNVVDSFAHLLKILVTPESRGLSIGKNLLIESLRILQERAIHTFYLEVQEENTVARKLYESMGFKIIHQKKHFYSNGGTAIIMTLSA